MVEVYDLGDPGSMPHNGHVSSHAASHAASHAVSHAVSYIHKSIVEWSTDDLSPTPTRSPTNLRYQEDATQCHKGQKRYICTNEITTAIIFTLKETSF